MTLRVAPVQSSRDLARFIRLPWRLYEGDTNWVPPLISEEKKLLDRKRNPFYEFSEAELFLAEREGHAVGRIAAIVNGNHNERHGEKCGWFGFFETVNDEKVSSALLAEAERWLKAKGMTVARGPANPSLNDTAGMLVDGFEWPPFVMMTYNPSWYPGHVESLGYRKAMDIFAWMVMSAESTKEKIGRLADHVRERGDIRIRNVNLSRFPEELRIVMDIYNDAWGDNWGFVPMTEAEIRHAAAGMKAVLLPELVYIAEYEGKPIAFSLALPDINRALRKCNGRLFPFGWIHLLKPMLRKLPLMRVIALGVRKQYQHMGIATLLYQRYLDYAVGLGWKGAEMSWVLETNRPMIHAMKSMGGKPYKKYRIYEKNL